MGQTRSPRSAMLGAETDHIRRAMRSTEEREEAPILRFGNQTEYRGQFSNASRTRMVAAYRSVRLPEVTGLPPVNNPGGDAFIPMSMVSGILILAADELAAIKPELAMRLALRVCSYDKDKGLQRALSRTRVATLSEVAGIIIPEHIAGNLFQKVDFFWDTESFKKPFLQTPRRHTNSHQVRTYPGLGQDNARPFRHYIDVAKKPDWCLRLEYESVERSQRCAPGF